MNTKGHERETLEYCLHHIEGGEAEASYLREDMWDKRKAALLAWEEHVTSLEQQARPDNVVRLAA